MDFYKQIDEAQALRDGGGAARLIFVIYLGRWAPALQGRPTGGAVRRCVGAAGGQGFANTGCDQYGIVTTIQDLY